eukprot:7731580-Lingulodinium_polyedra.AAC.1
MCEFQHPQCGVSGGRGGARVTFHEPDPSRESSFWFFGVHPGAGLHGACKWHARADVQARAVTRAR